MGAICCYIFSLSCTVLCPFLMNPGNGRVDVMGRTTGSQAVYDCDEGFAANGLIVRVCGENGMWSGDDTECVDILSVVCPPLPNPLDGTVTIISNNFRGAAIYSCKDGFTLMGINIVRTCTVSGEWSGTPPTCEGRYSVTSCLMFD